MKTKYLKSHLLMIIPLFVLAIIINFSFTSILNSKAKMEKIADVDNDLALNKNATPTYDAPAEELESVFEYQEGKTLGIDVSSWQGNIDWTKVRKSGVQFAMIRVGYRGYEGGDINIDKNFYKNLHGALDNGLQVGIYFYSAARNETEALKEAKWVISKIGPFKSKISYPVAFDLEDFNKGRLEGVSDRQFNKNAVAFLDYIAQNGYTPMLYGSRLRFGTTWSSDVLNKYRVWMAHYTEATDYKGKYDMWQYTSDGSITGIEGRVDINIAYFKVLTRERDSENEAVINNTKFINVKDSVVINTYANFRKSPTMELDNTITDSLAPGTTLQRIAVSEDGQWSRVIYNDKIGYIYNNYIKKI